MSFVTSICENLLLIYMDQLYLFHVFWNSFQSKLEAHLAKRAEHYFSENARVMKGIVPYRSLLLFLLKFAFS